MTFMFEDLYSNLERTIRIGKFLGEPFNPDVGIGQGDIFSMIPAIALVSWQFDMLDQLEPDLHKAACIDDRTICGDRLSVVRALQTMSEFDEACGQQLQHDKTIIGATDNRDRRILKDTEIKGIKPNICNVSKVVGTSLLTQIQESRTMVNGRMDRAIQVANMVSATPARAARKARAITTKAIPMILYGVSWIIPPRRNVSHSGPALHVHSGEAAGR